MELSAGEKLIAYRKKLQSDIDVLICQHQMADKTLWLSQQLFAKAMA